MANKKSSIRVGGILSYIAVFVNTAMVFFYTPWMIKQLGVSDYGLYSLVITFISYFVMDFGLSGTTTRFVAKYRAEGNQKKVENVLGLSLKVFWFIDMFIFLTIAIIYPFISRIFTGLTPEEIDKLRVLYLIAGTFNVLMFIFKPMHGASMAYELFIETKIIDLAQKVGTVLLIVIALLLGWGVYSLVFINGLIGFLSSCAFYFIFKHKTKIRINYHYFEKQEAKSLFSYSMWVFLSSMAQRFRLTFMPTLLGILSNSTQISIFALGMSIEGVVYTIASALNGLFLPRVSKYIHDGNHEAATDLMIKVGRIQLYIIALILSGFLLLGKDFLHLWVGDGFEDSYWVVLLLTGTNFISLPQHVASDVVAAENMVRYTSTYTFIASGGALLLSIILAPRYGALGCAIAFFFAMGLNIIQLNIFYKQRLKLAIGRFFKECYLRTAPLMLAVLVSFIIACRHIAILSWGMFALIGMLYVTIWSFVLYIFAFNTFEKEIILSIFKKGKH